MANSSVKNVTSTIGAVKDINAINAGTTTTTGSYLGAAQEAFGAYGAFNNPNLTNQQKAYQVQKHIGLAVADFYSAGLATLANSFAESHWGGTIGKAENLLMQVDPLSATVGFIDKNFGGKNKYQVRRDAVRSFFQKSNLADSNFQVKLADGSFADIGTDGHGGTHSARYADKLVDGGGKKGLHAYDTDYTNDLDYFSGQGGIALSRLLTGADGDHIKQVGSQLGNAALGKVGYGADMNQGNFNTVMSNLKSMYASAGINSKDEAYALSNKMFAAGKIDQMGLSQMQQTFNLVFDNDFNTANKLAAGRWNGIKVAGEATKTAQNGGVAPTVNTSGAIRENQPSGKIETLPEKITPEQSKELLQGGGLQKIAGVNSKEAIIAKNKQTFGSGFSGGVTA